MNITIIRTVNIIKLVIIKLYIVRDDRRYYKECKSEEDMTTAETLVLSKLKEYKEQANTFIGNDRDRFILPENDDISLFTKIVDECIVYDDRNIFFVSQK